MAGWTAHQGRQNQTMVEEWEQIMFKTSAQELRASPWRCLFLLITPFAVGHLIFLFFEGGICDKSE